MPVRYDRALVPDSLREIMGVPTLAEQEQSLAEMNGRQPASTTR